MSPRPPNILLIIADDFGVHQLGCTTLGGAGFFQTPHLDRLAARSVRVERAYVQYTVCNPSRSSFLTGLRPDQTGITDNRTPLRDRLPEVVTLPQLLKEDGRHAAAFGKIFHLGGGRDEALRARWMDLPRSWHTARSFEATPLGRKKLAGRDLSEGRLGWCHWGAAGGSPESWACKGQ